MYTWKYHLKPTLPTLLLLVFLVTGAGQLLCASVSPGDLRVPDAEKTQMITLNDGSKLTGRITEVRDDEVVFSSQVGELTIKIDQITEIKEFSSTRIKGGKYWFPNPNTNRLYFGPTGRTLKKGKGYFSDLLLFFPSVTYGITDNVSMGGGITIFPGVDFDKQLIYIFPKVGITPSENVALAGSILILRIPDFDDDDDDDFDLVDEPQVAGIAFGTGTFGTEDLSFTGGVGYGYVEDDFADKPAILLGGEWRFSRRLSFVTENWIFPGVEDALISYGLRFFGESISADLGLFTSTNEDAPQPGIPLVSFTWNF